MGVKALPMPLIPEETGRVAQAIVGDDLLAIQLRERLGTICTDEELAALFSASGQPTLAPWRVALVPLRAVRRRSHRSASRPRGAPRHRLGVSPLARPHGSGRPLCGAQCGAESSRVPACSKAEQRSGC